MAPSPFFSVIIPTYNRADFLPRAIQCVVEQQFADWELIIIDDGSTDGTKDVVRAFLADQRIRYHWQSNSELNAARNTGIRLAQGHYLAFLDDDDTFAPNHLQVLHTYLSEAASTQPVVRTGMWVQLYQQKQTSSFLDLQAFHPVQQLWLRPTNLLSFVFHRSVFTQHIFAEEFVLGDDFHFLIKVLLDFPLVQLEEFTVTYHQHPQTRTLRYFSPEKAANKFAAMEALWQEERDRLSPHIPAPWVKRWQGDQYLHFARLAFRAKTWGWAWCYFWQSLRFIPHIKFTKVLKTLGVSFTTSFSPKGDV